MNIFVVFPKFALVEFPTKWIRINRGPGVYLWNLQEQVRKAFCYQELFWTFAVWTNCSSDLIFFANSRPSALNFIFFSITRTFFFLTLGQNNFGNKIPWLHPFLFYNLSNLSSFNPTKSSTIWLQNNESIKWYYK